MEPLDLAVGMWSVGTGLFRSDPEFRAGITSGVGLVGGAVVREDAFDDTTFRLGSIDTIQEQDESLGGILSWYSTYVSNGRRPGPRKTL